MVRFLSGDRRMARTSAMGLRRDPQPPIPIVIPSRSSATTSSGVSHAPLIRTGPSTNACRARSPAPARFSSKVNPCSYR